MAKQKEETEQEKRQRETDEANAKLTAESDAHLAKHAEHLKQKEIQDKIDAENKLKAEQSAK